MGNHANFERRRCSMISCERNKKASDVQQECVEELNLDRKKLFKYLRRKDGRWMKSERHRNIGE